MANTRVPSSNELFNAYINNTDDYLQADVDSGPVKNWERLGIDADSADSWNMQRKYWQDTLYPKYSNPNLRTKTTTKEVQDFKTSFKDFANPLLNIMVASPKANAADEEVFNFVINRKKPTHSHTPISELCFGKFTALGGGEVKTAFSSATDSSRPSLLPGANCIQVAYKVGEPAPGHVEDGTRMDIVPRASYVLDLGSDHSGKKLYIYQRWFNSKYPELAGPWSALQTVMII